MLDCVDNMCMWWRAEIMLKDRYGVLANSFWAQTGCEKAVQLRWHTLSIPVIFHVCFPKWTEQNSTFWQPIPKSCFMARFKAKHKRNTSGSLMPNLPAVRTESVAMFASCSARFFFTHIIVVYSCIFSCIVALQAFGGFWCFAWLEFYCLCTRRTCWTKLLFTPILFGRCSSFLHKTNYCRWKQCMKLNLAENAKWFEPNAGLMLTPAHFGNCQSSSWATWHQHQRTTSMQGQPVKFLVVAAKADGCTDFCQTLAIRNRAGKMHPDHHGCPVFP